MTVSSKKIAAGMSWVALISYSNRILGFLTTLILAKLLDPEHFGLVAIASMIIEILRLLKDMGLSEALIFKKNDIEEASNTIYILLVGYNIILFLIASLLSPFMASFYENDLVMPVVIVMSSNLIWDSLRVVPRTLLRKNIDFKKLVIPEVLPVIISSIIGLFLACLGFGVWSLVVRSVIYSILGMILLGRIYPFKPKLQFNKEIAIELFQYGKFIIASTIMLVLVYNIDKFYVSKFAGIEYLGFYELAIRISNLPVKEFSSIIGSVMFPVLSKMNQSNMEMKNTFLKTIKYTTLVSIPMAIGISTYGPELVKIVYGDKWIPMAVPLQILALFALFRSISSLIHDVFKATGNPKLMQQFVLFRLISIGILGIPALKLFGINGLSALVSITYLIILIFEIHTVNHLLGLSYSNLYKIFVKSLLLSVSTIIIPFILILKLVNDLPLLILLLGITVSILIYFLVIFFTERELVIRIKTIIIPNT